MSCDVEILMMCLATDDPRPREELIAYGADRMSTPGLLAIVLGTGQRGQSAAELGARVLAEQGGIVPLSLASPSELCTVSGIGQALATRIVASFQLGRRALEAGLPTTGIVRGPEDVYHRLRTRLGGLGQEVFVVLALDVRGHIIDEIEVARGTVASVEVHPREVFRPLIRRSAFACVVAHNHPSGDPQPSEEDYLLGARLQAVGQLVGIELLDHIVITSGGFCSMAERLHG